LSYDPATDALTQTVIRQGTGTTTSATYASVTTGTAAVRPQAATPTRWTTIRFSVTNRANTIVNVTSLAVSSCPQLAIPALSPAANSTATTYITAPLGTAFTISGTLTLSGNFPSSQELNKIEIGVG
jgi:hypothetical protein